MNQRENNEIDNLLRGLARTDRAASSARSLSAGGESAAEPAGHLDADELNAYAENALPDAARSRYTAHLADCGDCRQIVTQLSVAIGMPAPERSQEAVAMTWREKLAALLSPSVWRYAMPALVLFVVVAVGFFALRLKRESSFVAQKQQGEQSRPSAVQEGQSSSAAPAAGGTKTAANPEPSASRTHSPTPATGSRADDNAGATSEATATPAVALAEDKDSSRKQTAADQPVAAEAPAPPATAANKTIAAAPPARSADEIRAESGAGKNKEGDRKSVAGNVTGPAQAPRKAAAARPQSGRAGEPAEARASGGAPAADKAEEDTETRTVAGRRFHRRNGVWVDVAFDSSRSTINVARGSEQYRALIADEPEIRKIAEQLSGPVIVVWNGHAYRIQ